MEDPQEDPLAVHCFCVCSGSVLLGDLLGLSRSMERDLLSVLSIFCECVRCVSSLVSDCFVVFCCMFLCVSCFCLVVSTYQVMAWKTLLMTSLRGEEITSTNFTLKRSFVCIFFVLFGVFMLLCVSPSPTQYTCVVSAESAIKHQHWNHSHYTKLLKLITVLLIVKSSLNLLLK